MMYDMYWDTCLKEISGVDDKCTRDVGDIIPKIIMEDLETSNLILEEDGEYVIIGMLVYPHCQFGLGAWRVVMGQQEHLFRAIHLFQMVRFEPHSLRYQLHERKFVKQHQVEIELLPETFRKFFCGRGWFHNGHNRISPIGDMTSVKIKVGEVLELSGSINGTNLLEPSIIQHGLGDPVVDNLEEPPLRKRVRHRFDYLLPSLWSPTHYSGQVYDRNVSLRLRTAISGLRRWWLVIHKDARQFGNARINEPLDTYLGLIEGFELALAIGGVGLKFELHALQSEELIYTVKIS
ncbi:hypothetical protein Cgig2_027557 [Carnegiea gigantea]|uniref:Uncharacterized protein n=1 Tax=Carnegiea gigantea TaxID=171969 RepID=A0A9Q1JVJ4_9CARY|nr:hypothetical protein Cgig2_027557 [Carnegiea gigantea]